MTAARPRRERQLTLRLSMWPSRRTTPTVRIDIGGDMGDKRGADVRPDFNWNKQPVEILSYR
ncbi:MAG: hypothetical protein KGL35_02785 [Bradyrhizobium sp.]|uniref:hypothetical protein n=1 Tax=Bradyrhizobium sp. TaxID=376 RepID=UPI001C299855|nr:hypothetical protein [Bradyrhizobium sp.]MBU6461356.1 hypothetical protein [Pseudomonadota bacterium]MDE2066531.1 hypothetical protein [Bradyrhizobium sp.]MDE2467679.1 hypothetical protein [Bradyrhizobium sp.]